MIFKRIGNGRPYPDHGRESTRQWADVAPRPVRLDQLVTTKQQLDLETLLAEDSTFYGDLFAHVVKWQATSTWKTGCTAPCARPCNNARCCTPASWNWADARPETDRHGPAP